MTGRAVAVHHGDVRPKDPIDVVLLDAPHTPLAPV